MKAPYWSAPGLACALVLIAQAAEAASGPEITLSLDPAFYSWERDEDGAKGWQIVTPLTASASRKPLPELALDISMRTAYIVSVNETDGASGRYTGPSDTNFGISLALLDQGWWQPFVTIDLNLPTGQETLAGREKRAIMDPDLVGQIRFGEGFNTNVVAGGTIPLDETLALTVAGGVNFRGAYTPDGDSGLSYDPGTQLSAYAALQYLDGRLSGSFSVKYFDEVTSTRGGIDYYNPGDELEFEIEAAYALDDVSALSALVHYETAQANQYYNFFTGTLADEDANSNGDIIFATATYSRDIGGAVLRLTALGLVRTANDYDAVNDLFIPERTKWEVRIGADGKFDEHAKWGANIGYGEVVDDPTAFITTGLHYDYWVARLSLGLEL